ncbi:hypothetical protein ABW22_09155 [Thiobacillus denitrificans]|uniref:Tape measure protein N-terminal domain-containing protein n=2 Tax=Thiobacillus denitrificans TaxID=36861 RepID=A0A106BPZ8_THIDE|nr:hypothetical protein ABW22_09155 [Thiobacillus denitrificans]
MAAKLVEINAAAAQSKRAFDNALTAARNFGRGGQSAAQGMGGQLKSIALQAVGVAAAFKGIGAVINTGIASQRLEAKFQFAAGGDTAKAAGDLAFVRAEAERLALPILEAADGFSKLAAATQGTAIEGEKTRAIFTGISSAMRVLGAQNYTVERSFTAITQALSKGQLQAEEIRGQLAEHIPGAFRILANALGITEQKLNKDLKGGLVDSATAMVAFAKELERMSQSGLLAATQSFQAQTVRLSNTLFDFRDTIAKAGLLDVLGAEITTLTDKLREMADTGELQAFAKDFAQVVSDIARILGTATRFAIEHRDAIAKIAVLYAGFRIAKAVQGVELAWAAVATRTVAAGAAITGVGGAARILLALLGGPVGIGAAILAAGAAWLIFREKATDALDAATEKLGGLRKTLNQSILQFNAGGLAGDAAVAAAAGNAQRLKVAYEGALKARAALAGKNVSLSTLDSADTDIKTALSDLQRAGRFYAEAVKQKEQLDKAKPKTAAPGSTGDKPDKGALSAAQREAEALLKAQEALDKARAEAEALGLSDSLAARKEIIDQRRKAELIDEETFIRAKALLNEEGLRNELAALQDQQAALRAAAVTPGAKGSERTQALAELALVEARILSAGDKILNLNQATTAELAALGAAKFKTQAEFIAGLEQEARLAKLNTEEREKELLLLEAKKLGITDVNRLLELQAQINQAAKDKDAAKELQRQQDDVYKSVQEGVQRAFADGLNAVATGEGGFAGALKNLVDTIRNALANALAGSLTEGFLGLLGGKEGVLNIAGTLGFGGKRDGGTIASAVYVQDVSKGPLAGLTGAKSGEGVLGDTTSLFGGLFESIKGIFSGIGSTISSLFKSLASSISGLFSSGGSGGGGSSSTGGFISSLISIFASNYADGGYTGDGGKYEPKGVVHGGEYVFSKDAVRRLGLSALDNMHRIASGGFIPRMPRWGYADGGAVNLPAAGAAPSVNANTRIHNYFDLDSAMSGFMNTRAGERAILNIIQRNPGAVGG